MSKKMQLTRAVDSFTEVAESSFSWKFIHEIKNFSPELDANKELCQLKVYN